MSASEKYISESLLKDSPKQALGFKLKNGIITSNKIAAGAITSDKIVDDAITGDKIANGAVTTLKIENGAVTNSKIGNNTITAEKIRKGTITGDKIADGAITSDKLSESLLAHINGAGYPKIKISELDSMCEGAEDLATRAANLEESRFVVVDDNDIVVGYLDVLSDTGVNVLTQVLTTHYTFEDGVLSTSKYIEGAVYQYYRSYHVSSNSSGWWPWRPLDNGLSEDFQNYLDKATYLNSDDKNYLSSEHLPKDVTESVLMFAGFVSDITVIDDRTAPSNAGVYFDTDTNDFVCKAEDSPSAVYFSQWSGSESYRKNLSVYSNKLFVDTSANKLYRFDSTTLVEVSPSAVIDLSKYARTDALNEFDGSQTVNDGALRVRIEEEEFPMTAYGYAEMDYHPDGDNHFTYAYPEKSGTLALAENVSPLCVELTKVDDTNYTASVTAKEVMEALGAGRPVTYRLTAIITSLAGTQSKISYFYVNAASIAVHSATGVETHAVNISNLGGTTVLTHSYDGTTDTVIKN